MIKHMGMELISMLTAQLTLVTGSKTSSMVVESKHGPTVLDTTETTRTERKMAKVYSLLQMEAFILVLSSKTKSQAAESMSGPMVKPTKACGRRTKCMAEVFSNGKTASNTKETSKMISAKVMACSPGEMAASMMDNGKMANNMEKEYLSRMKAPEESESGRVDATLNG